MILLLVFLALITSPAKAQQSATPLNLQAVADLYIERNLELQAARYRLERTKADQIAARLRPNPGITVTAENFVFTGPTPFGRVYEVATSYSETIELGGKRKLRERAADATVSAAEAQFADAMRRGVAAGERVLFEDVLGRLQGEVGRGEWQKFGPTLHVKQTRGRGSATTLTEPDKARV